jgi:hypothetical protein
MVSSKDKQIRESLEDAGIAKYSYKHTLRSLNRQDLHDWVVNEEFYLEEAYRSFIFTPENVKAIKDARLLFYTMAKTMMLKRQSVLCVSLMSFSKACSGDWRDLLEEIHSATFVFITDFCEKGSEPPLNSYANTMVRSKIKELIEGQTHGVALFSEVRRDSLDKSGWWGEGFRQWISENFDEMLVKNNEK